MNDLANCPDFDYVVHQDGMLQFHAKGLKARGRTTTADSFETFEGAKVQELHRRRMEGVAQIEVVAQAFDFTMCQVWYDGKAVRCLHPEVLDDIENKLLVVTPIADCVKALTEGRALRFVAEGWTLAPEQAAAVLNVQSRSGSASQRGSQ